MFSYHHSAVPKCQISTSLDVWFLKITLRVADLDVIKNCEVNFGLRFPITSPRGLNRRLLFLCYMLCEAAVSALTIIKSEYRSTLENTEDALCLAASNIPPRCNSFCKNIHTYLPR